MEKKQCNKQLDKNHFVNVNPYGTLKPYKPILVGPDISKIQTSYTDVDAMFETIRAGNKRHIALFFHGGLVGECSGMAAAERFYHFYNGVNDVYPVSFIWETGFVSSLIEYVKDAVGDSYFQSIFGDAASRILSKLGIKVPGITEDEGKPHISFIKTNDFFYIESQQKILEIETAAAGYKHLSLEEIEKELLSETNPFEQKAFHLYEMNKNALVSNEGFLGINNVIWAGIKVAARCIYRFARKRDHGIKGTVLEETYRQIKVGNFVSVEKTAIGIWDQMKQQAASMWKSNDHKKGDDQFAGRYFWDKLSEYTKEVQKQGGNVVIELVAHSAGAIAICELFDMLKKNNNLYGHITFNNVLFMAPAVKCDLFYETVMPMKNRYNRFRMFTMHMDFERKDILIDEKYLHWVYPLSLLYLVSGLCEDGDKWFDEDVKGDTCLLGLDQHICGKSPYTEYEIMEEIHNFLFENGEYKNRIALVPSAKEAPIGYRGKAEDHGFFDNDGDDREEKNTISDSIRESITHLFKEIEIDTNVL
ncbi:alpha/beta hydrolase [Flavobacterium enshiense]|nr:alpha/beta hydrolase [Flavobacterium enshiense]